MSSIANNRDDTKQPNEKKNDIPMFFIHTNLSAIINQGGALLAINQQIGKWYYFRMIDQRPFRVSTIQLNSITRLKSE